MEINYVSELHNISLRKCEKLSVFKESLSVMVAFFAGLTVAFAMSSMISLMALSSFVFVITLILRIVIARKFKNLIENEVSEFQKDLGELHE